MWLITPACVFEGRDRGTEGQPAIAQHFPVPLGVLLHYLVLLPIFMTLPKTEVLSTVLQFHRRCRNWYWHSLMALRAPSPMNTMCSW